MSSRRGCIRATTRPMRYLLLLAAVSIGCGDDANTARDAAVGTDDAPADGSEMPTCGSAGPAEMECGGVCVDTSSDPMHCGNCTTACSGTTSACGAGTCIAPTTSWVKQFGGGDFGYGVAAVAVDGAGNTYATGYFQTMANLGGDTLMSAGSQDIVVASFAPNGTHRWSKRFGGTGNDQGAGITVAGGKVYVTGSFSGSVDFGGGVRTSQGGSDDVFVLVLNATDGVHVDDRGYGGTGDDAGIDIVVDANGNVTFGGFFVNGTIDFGGTSLTTPAFIGFVASVDPAWAHRWSRRMGGNVASNISAVQSLAIDPAGNVAVALNFQGSDDFGSGSKSSMGTMFDAVAASYTSTGVYRWVRQFGVTGSDTAETIACDANGNVLVGGGFHGTVNFGSGNFVQDGVIDGWVAVLEAGDGATRWSRQLGSDTSSATRSVAFDPDGNAVVSANIEGATDLGTGALQLYDQYDILLAGMDKTSGTTQFANVYGGTDFEGGSAIAVTKGGNIAVGGYFRGTVNFGLASGMTAGGTKDNGFVMMVVR
jgi:hypothetical protein